MKKLILQIIIAVVLVTALGVGAYVGIKKIIGLFALPDISTAQRKIDEFVSELDGAISDLSGFRDSIGIAQEGLSTLTGELDRSTEAAARTGEQLELSIRRERELKEILGRAEDASGILAEGIGKNETALDRLGKYINSSQGDSGYRTTEDSDGP